MKEPNVNLPFEQRELLKSINAITEAALRINDTLENLSKQVARLVFATQQKG